MNLRCFRPAESMHRCAQPIACTRRLAPPVKGNTLVRTNVGGFR